MTNNSVLAGRLISDSQLKFTKNGNAVCNFTIANNRRTASGEETTFMDIVIFGNYANSMHPHLKKGLTVDVTGKIVQESWNNDGKTYHKHKIYAKEIDFRTPKNQTNNLEETHLEEDYYQGDNYEQ